MKYKLKAIERTVQVLAEKDDTVAANARSIFEPLLSGDIDEFIDRVGARVGRGENSVKYQIANAKRDQHMQVLATQFFAQGKRVHRGEKISRTINAYGSSACWRHTERSLAENPHPASKIEHHLWEILQLQDRPYPPATVDAILDKQNIW